MTKTKLPLGARVRARRTALGLTQTALGALAGMRGTEVCDLEHSPKAGVGSRRLARLADALDCSADWLLGRADAPEPSQKRDAPGRSVRPQDRRKG